MAIHIEFAIFPSSFEENDDDGSSKSAVNLSRMVLEELRGIEMEELCTTTP